MRAATEADMSRGAKPSCLCGNCPTCKERARWNRSHRNVKKKGVSNRLPPTRDAQGKWRAVGERKPQSASFADWSRSRNETQQQDETL